jgi:hypothetical protein
MCAARSRPRRPLVRRPRLKVEVKRLERALEADAPARPGSSTPAVDRTGVWLRVHVREDRDVRATFAESDIVAPADLDPLGFDVIDFFEQGLVRGTLRKRQDIQTLGTLLYRALFPGPIATALGAGLRRTREVNERLRIGLSFQASPRLEDLPGSTCTRRVPPRAAGDSCPLTPARCSPAGSPPTPLCSQSHLIAGGSYTSSRADWGPASRAQCGTTRFSRSARSTRW